MERKIERKQITLIKIGQAKLELDDDKYRLILNQRYWVNTCKNLSYDDATDLLKHFQTMGFKIVTKKYNRGQGFKGSRGQAENIIQLVSRQQLALIDHLREDIQWRIHDGYYRWLRKWLRKDRITTSKEAFRVIEGLKSMLKQQQQKQIHDAGCTMQDAR